MSHAVQHEHEYIEVLTPNGDPTGEVVLREKIYADLLPHHIVHLMVINSRGEFILQRRSQNKSYMPGKLVTTGSGHVKAGEGLLEATARELGEEAGEEARAVYTKNVTADQIRILRYEDPERPGFVKFLGVSELKYDGELLVQDENDIAGFEAWSRERIEALPAPAEEFHPEAYFILKTVYGLNI